jgi:hypothetical protein
LNRTIFPWASAPGTDGIQKFPLTVENIEGIVFRIYQENIFIGDFQLFYSAD